MSLQGPIVIVADKPIAGLAEALGRAGAIPVVEAMWPEAPAAVAKIKPSAVILAQPDAAAPGQNDALCRQIADAEPFLPVLVQLPDDDSPSAFPNAISVPADASAEQIIARLSSALRVRALHATVLGRARTLKAARNIIAELPETDPIEDATVLVVGRGRSHPVLSVAVGERMGVMGALSVEAAALCLNAREIEGIAIGEGLSSHTIGAFLEALSQDSRFRDLPVGALGFGPCPEPLPNFLRAGDPATLVERLLPLIRLRAFEGRLKRLLDSIERKGMLDAQTGLFNYDAFGRELERAIEDAGQRGVALSVSRFSFDQSLDRRSSQDAARLIGRLVRGADFACRLDDGSIVTVFAETDLRAAHVVARRLAAVLKHTMLRPAGETQPLSPTVTLATLKPGDTVLTLVARVAPRPVAAE